MFDVERAWGYCNLERIKFIELFETKGKLAVHIYKIFERTDNPSFVGMYGVGHAGSFYVAAGDKQFSELPLNWVPA